VESAIQAPSYRRGASTGGAWSRWLGAGALTLLTVFQGLWRRLMLQMGVRCAGNQAGTPATMTLDFISPGLGILLRQSRRAVASLR